MAQVQRIDPVIIPQKETVAAYCRVSTDSKDQLNSYQTQISYYTKLIAENPEWELVDVYADAGITGTSIEKRDEFKRMLADCRAGKIKRVLVKSVSRFARNTIELLETTRELRELGVVVVFEEQGIDTSQMLGEMQLTMFALAAQEESTSISKNMRWSYQKRMESGRFVGCKAAYGYRLSDGTLCVVPEEKQIVEIIFMMYLSGVGIGKIAIELNKNKVPTRYKDCWSYATVRQILTNERYTGNSLLQKYYTVDTLKHIKRENKGQLPKYYVENSHEAVILQDDFERAQEMLESRNNNKKRVQHLFTHKIQCPDCGHFFRHYSCNGKSYWICTQRFKNTSGCTLYRLSENAIIQTTANMLSKLYLNQEKILFSTMAMLHEIEYKQSTSKSKLYELGQSISALNDKALVLQRLQNKGFITPEEYRSQSDALASQRMKFTLERKKKLEGSPVHAFMEKLEELQSTLASWPGVPTEFDIGVFDEIVEKIIPAENGILRFRLRCGLELKEAIPQ